MLILTRKVGEKIIIDKSITVSVVGIRGGQVKIAIEAPPEIEIQRAEIHSSNPKIKNTLKQNEEYTK